MTYKHVKQRENRWPFVNEIYHYLAMAIMLHVMGYVISLACFHDRIIVSFEVKVYSVFAAF